MNRDTSVHKAARITCLFTYQFRETTTQYKKASYKARYLYNYIYMHISALLRINMLGCFKISLTSWSFKLTLAFDSNCYKNTVCKSSGSKYYVKGPHLI